MALKSLRFIFVIMQKIVKIKQEFFLGKTVEISIFEKEKKSVKCKQIFLPIR